MVPLSERVREMVPLPDMDSTETGGSAGSMENPLGPVPEDVTASESVSVTESDCPLAETGRGSMSFMVTCTCWLSAPPSPSETVTSKE